MALRWGIVGLGIGRAHAQALQKVEGVELYAACDVIPEILDAFCQEFAIPHRFTDFNKMLESEVEAVSICTPHYLHAPQTIAALKAGKSVLCEKPLCITVSEADEMIATAKTAHGKAGIVFQYRTEPWAKVAKKVIEEGGTLVRGLYQAHHYRNQAYYGQGRWRGTWWGEGGGVLINQAIHDLDLMAFLVGLPQRVTARLANWGHPQVEVEDLATGVLEWATGAQLAVHISSVGLGAPIRFDVTMDRYTLVLEDGRLRLGRFQPTLSEDLQSNAEPWGKPKVQWEDLPIDKDQPHGHGEAIAAFARAVLRDEAPPTPLSEGLLSMELMNGFVLSHFTGRTVSLPVCRQEYEDLLSALKSGTVKLKRGEG
ncbi:MAG: Gfo/Idh/MocA family oxidoreductase [Armatimonadetes bacterium]|nr:Gfo/Idh/MocA family oxidoreductase [Armatimonadota bacterium]MDW8122802.1 Gfo/Idh/MocA family oxidoreductase [Armatimonadota bacterium]